jgi:hypothetical protein
MADGRAAAAWALRARHADDVVRDAANRADDRRVPAIDIDLEEG